MKKHIKSILFLFFAVIVAAPVFGYETALEEENYNYVFDFSNDSILQKYSAVKSKKNTVHEKAKENKFVFFGYGSLNFGQVTYYPYTLVEGDPSNYTSAFGPNPAKPYNFSYGFGVGIDYRMMNFLALFFDGGYNTWKLLLAKKDGYAYGQWVAESTDYTNAVVGPFTMDTYYYMDTTALRVGARYVASLKGLLQPWIGAGIGLYAWQATIGNRQEEKKYGNISSGMSFGFSFLGGMDLVFKDFIIRLYIDYGSGLAYPKISGLLSSPYDTAVFETTAGEHATGPYKVGLAFGVRY